MTSFPAHILLHMPLHRIHAVRTCSARSIDVPTLTETERVLKANSTYTGQQHKLLILIINITDLACCIDRANDFSALVVANKCHKIKCLAMCLAVTSGSNKQSNRDISLSKHTLYIPMYDLFNNVI